MDSDSIKKTVLPRTKIIYEKNPADITICLTVLGCLEKILDKLDRAAIIDEVLPLLQDVRLQDADVTIKVVSIYKLMLNERRAGLSVNLLATRILPSILPLTISPSLNLEQFTFLLLTIHEMIDVIDKQQRNKLKLDNMTLTNNTMDTKRSFRHQLSSDNMNLSTLSPYSVIGGMPNVRIHDSRMSSSAEDVLPRRGSSGPSSPDSHLLRVQSAGIGRRLSDNELTMPPKIKVAFSSAASSPGDLSPGGLPIRRHSSIGSERRGSTCSALLSNLSPPALSRTLVSGTSKSVGHQPKRSHHHSPPSPCRITVQGVSISSASKSVPMLLTPSTIASLSSRRPSACSITSLGGLDSRRSSIISQGGASYKSSRRPSTLLSNASSGNLLQQLSAGVVGTYQLFSSK